MTKLSCFIAGPSFEGYKKIGTDVFESWYSNAITNNGTGTVSLALNVIRYLPIVLSNQMTIDRFSMEVTTAGTASAVARLGIYASSNNLPTDLILDAGEIAVDSTGVKTINVNQLLAPGLYFMAFNHNSAASVSFRSNTGTAAPPVWGYPSSPGTGSAITMTTVSDTYGGGYVLPNPAINPTAAVGTSMPLLFLRFSA